MTAKCRMIQLLIILVLLRAIMDIYGMMKNDSLIEPYNVYIAFCHMMQLLSHLPNSNGTHSRHCSHAY